MQTFSCSEYIYTFWKSKMMSAASTELLKGTLRHNKDMETSESPLQILPNVLFSCDQQSIQLIVQILVCRLDKLGKHETKLSVDWCSSLDRALHSIRSGIPCPNPNRSEEPHRSLIEYSSQVCADNDRWLYAELSENPNLFDNCRSPCIFDTRSNLICLRLLRGNEILDDVWTISLM